MAVKRRLSVVSRRVHGTPSELPHSLKPLQTYLIKEDAINEKCSVEVLRILIAKGDAEILELDDDIGILQSQLKWAEHGLDNYLESTSLASERAESSRVIKRIRSKTTVIGQRGSATSLSWKTEESKIQGAGSELAKLKDHEETDAFEAPVKVDDVANSEVTIGDMGPIGSLLLNPQTLKSRRKSQSNLRNVQQSGCSDPKLVQFVETKDLAGSWKSSIHEGDESNLSMLKDVIRKLSTEDTQIVRSLLATESDWLRKLPLMKLKTIAKDLKEKGYYKLKKSLLMDQLAKELS
ncbi:hypothetical protein Nepgr_031248 [Nepenthes gracilis]|uniref:Rho termination factor N-terminal domain-containing protein n=1 Tax=Nepenthes gracilis TaxID=150966 RepID=A0AAD3TGC2_NEPGR|nr:hypothetical protein Nepgr_031248 [Nepenthes gracilis]